MNFISTLGYSIFSDDLSKIKLSESCKLCNTISPNSYGIATKDSLFSKSLKETDYLVLDGVYFALASILLKGKNIKKNQGPDVFDFFIKKMNKEKGRVFFLGSTQTTLDSMQARLKIDYPNVSAGFLSPPFKQEFSSEENDIMVDAINKFKPDIVFVGMTCPKQEIWSFQNKNRINTKLICSIGAVFDWFAGNYKEIPKIWWTLRLGWLIRYIQRPNLVIRDSKNDFIFFKDLIIELTNKLINIISRY